TLAERAAGGRRAGRAVRGESRSTGARAETRTRGGRERCGLGIAFTKRKPNARIVSECVTSSGSKKNSLPHTNGGHSTEHRRCCLVCARRGRAKRGTARKKRTTMKRSGTRVSCLYPAQCVSCRGG